MRIVFGAATPTENSMTKSRYVAALLGSAVGCALIAATASAQTATAGSGAPAGPNPPASATPAPADEQAIVVTGTLFRRKETVSPVTTLSTENLRAAGITTIADAVRSISADSSGTIPTAFGVGFAAGSSGVALRGLTVNSTLVLIDGLRTANYPLADDGQRGFVDLNSIPESLIDRVEVLKDGASSTYGADAIGGVVNIIFKKTFTGLEANAEGGASQHGGGTYYNFSALAGWGDLARDGYNVYIDAEYQHDSAIRVGQRGFPFNTKDLSSIGGNNVEGGQPGQSSGSIYGSVTPGTLKTVGDLLSGVPVVNPDGSNAVAQILRPSGCGALGITKTDGTGTYCQQNFTRYGDDQPEQTRYGFTGRLTKQLGGDWTGYVSASYYENRVYVDNAPSQIQTSTPNNTNGLALPVTLSNGQLNPNNPFAAQGQVALINYAFGEIPAYATEQNHVWRGVADLTGTLAGFHVDIAGVAAHADLKTVNAGFVNYSQLISDINTGAYNFIDPTQNTAATLAALAPSLSKTSKTDLDMLQFSATRAVFELPGGPLNLGFGGSFRYEATFDPDLNPNLSAQGLGVAHTIGHHYVTSGFFEVDAPVIKQIDVNVSGRYDHYTDAGNNFSPKIGVKFMPTRQFTFRGTYSQGFRAPSFSENGSSAAEGFINETLPQSFIDNHKDINGVPSGYVAPYPLALLTSANPNVKPEKSYSYTLGAIVKPVHWLTMSADYYHIIKKGIITQSDPNAVLAAYFAGQPLPANSSVIADRPDPQFPNALARPIVVSAPYVNANSLETEGVDVDVLANFSLPHEIRLSSEVEFTDIFAYRFNNSGTVVDYVGTQSPYITSSGAGTPQWRGRWQTTVSKGPLTLSGTAYYVSSIRLAALDIAPGCFSTNTASGANFPASCRQDAFIDVDFTADYKINPRVSVFVNMLNAFDARPPIDPINYAGTNYNPTYTQAGIVGRFFKAGVHVRY
jgi:iron complex outermembrane receptor protein